MYSPTIAELPSPPEGKTGWPWTEESSRVSETMSSGCEWPRVSIVTPSFNQGEFIEETIRSVLLQGYPNLEYIISDGGSTDNTLEIIRKYEPWITSWVSEDDNGQTHAINKGFRKSSGVIVAWLNSDDAYTMGTISRVVECFCNCPDVALIYGHCAAFDEGSQKYVKVTRPGEFVLAEMFRADYIAQPATFFKKEVIGSIGYLDENLHYAMDYDLLLKIGQKYGAKALPRVLAKFRLHNSSKSVVQKANFLPEEFYVLDNLLKNYSSSSQETQIIQKTENDHLYFSGAKSSSNVVLDHSCIVSAYSHMIRNVLLYSNLQMLNKKQKLPDISLWDGLSDLQNLKSDDFYYYLCNNMNLDPTKTNISELEYCAFKQYISQVCHILNQRYQIIPNEMGDYSQDSQLIMDLQILLPHILLNLKNKSLSRSYFFKLIKDNPQIILQSRTPIFVIKYIMSDNIFHGYLNLRDKLRMSLRRF